MGGEIFISTGEAETNSGSINVCIGSSTVGSGGELSLQAGTTRDEGGSGGSTCFAAGDGSRGGAIDLRAGVGDTSGGDVEIAAGVSTRGTGGSMEIAGGAGA